MNVAVTKPMSNITIVIIWDIYIRFFHFLRFSFGDLSKPFAFGADNFSIPITDHLLVILKKKRFFQHLQNLLFVESTATSFLMIGR